MRPPDDSVTACSTSGLAIRPLQMADLPAALAIQSEVYPAFLREDLAAFASRLAVVPSYCLAATRDERLVAYLLAHGWATGSPPPIGAVLQTHPPREVLFIHDLAVSAAGRGAAIGRNLFERVAGLAGRDGLRHAELIAVEGAAPYWQALGFADAAATGELAAKVAAYGPAARWMRKEIVGA